MYQYNKSIFINVYTDKKTNKIVLCMYLISYLKYSSQENNFHSLKMLSEHLKTTQLTEQNNYDRFL